MSLQARFKCFFLSMLNACEDENCFSSPQALTLPELAVSRLNQDQLKAQH